MLIEHRGCQPVIHDTACVALTATIRGDVTLGPGSVILPGAIVTAEGGEVRIGASCVIMENAVLRGTPGHPLIIGDRVLVGPHAHLTGCTVEDEAFLATSCSVFTGATIGHGTEVRIRGTVHLKTTTPSHATIPIGWVAVGDPCQILAPDAHDEIWAIQKPLGFPETVFGVDRPLPGKTIMPEVMPRYANSLARHYRGSTRVE